MIPQDAKLTPWPKDLLKKWDALTADEKKLFIRQVDVYAAYLAYTDHEIGRVIQAVEDMGKLDNTLIIYISGDNGSSAEGTLVGTPNEVAMFNGVEVPVAVQLKHFYDAWGSDKTYNHMAVPWTWAFDTPFSWTKQIASHFGGTRQGMAISWPKRIKDKGGIRNQFHHVIDIVPTILEATGIPQPEMVDGIAQRPIEGVSMAYTFDKANADAPSRHKTQYFEMMGDHALYHDGWIASTKVMRPPWDRCRPVNQDPANDVPVGAVRPDQGLDAVRRRGRQGARQAQGVAGPVLGRGDEVPGLAAGRLGGHAARRAAAEHHGRPQRVHLLRRDDRHAQRRCAEHPQRLVHDHGRQSKFREGGAEGMIVTQGGRFGGYGFYLLKGKPVFLWNLVDLKRLRWEGPEALTPGKHTLEFDFKYDGLGIATLAFNNISGIGRGGAGMLKVDGKEVANQKMEHTIPFILQWDENFDVGSDTGTPVDDKDYQVPFKFTGKLNKLTLKIDRPKLTPERRSGD